MLCSMFRGCVNLLFERKSNLCHSDDFDWAFLCSISSSNQSQFPAFFLSLLFIEWNLCIYLISIVIVIVIINIIWLWPSVDGFSKVWFYCYIEFYIGNKLNLLFNKIITRKTINRMQKQKRIATSFNYGVVVAFFSLCSGFFFLCLVWTSGVKTFIKWSIISKRCILSKNEWRLFEKCQ